MIVSPEQRAFIESQRIARLATVDEHAHPHIVPICFALDPPRETLYTPIDEKPKRGDYAHLRRLRNIAANPNVQVLFDVYDDADWTRLRYLQLRATARILEPDDEHARAITLLRARYQQYAAMALESRPVIAVDVVRVVGWRGANP
jgi:PPOX class probable F420-dependent enzyme